MPPKVKADRSPTNFRYFPLANHPARISSYTATTFTRVTSEMVLPRKLGKYAVQSLGSLYIETAAYRKTAARPIRKRRLALL